jgi:hypothetical protein
MTGLLVKKYHVAVLASANDNFMSQVIASLQQWYNDRVVIKAYSDTYSLFEAVSVNKAKNKPFDCAVLNPRQMAEKMVLQRSNPLLKVIVCEDTKQLRQEASKVML